jgi:hypothetical protein
MSAQLTDNWFSIANEQSVWVRTAAVWDGVAPRPGRPPARSSALSATALLSKGSATCAVAARSVRASVAAWGAAGGNCAKMALRADNEHTVFWFLYDAMYINKTAPACQRTTLWLRLSIGSTKLVCLVVTRHRSTYIPVQRMQ